MGYTLAVKIIKQEPLKPWSWWRTGGTAEYFCQPENPEELKEALSWANKNNQEISVLGGGTNVLISDEGVKGLVISTGKLSSIYAQEEKGGLKVSAGAGASKSALCAAFRKYHLAPALFLSGLPGDVGGGVVMNAGAGTAFPSEFSQIVEGFEIMTHQGVRHYNKEDIEWSYRRTSGWKPGVIFKIGFFWPSKKENNLNQKIKSGLKKRRVSQPLSQPSCGSVFKNPKGQFAGELIEKSGLKGLKKGAAMISEKHGNFIVNLGEACSKDIDHLIQKVQSEVRNKFNISLETEVHYLGKWENRGSSCPFKKDKV